MNFQSTIHPSINPNLSDNIVLPTNIDVCCCCCLLQKSCCDCYCSYFCQLPFNRIKDMLTRELLICQISTQSLSYIVKMVSFKRDHHANCCMMRDMHDISSSEKTKGEICSYQYSSITCFL